MELDEGEREELVRLRAENAILRDSNRFLREGITVFAKGMCSLVALPLDLPDQGDENLTPVLIDLAGAEQVRFESSGG